MTPVTPNNPCLTCTKECSERGKAIPMFTCQEQYDAGFTATSAGIAVPDPIRQVE